jgi:hypothetical protein
MNLLSFVDTRLVRCVLIPEGERVQECELMSIARSLGSVLRCGETSHALGYLAGSIAGQP